jgi:hypothetical protein
VPEDGTALKETEEKSDVMIMDRKTYSRMTGQKNNRKQEAGLRPYYLAEHSNLGYIERWKIFLLS